MTEKFRNIVKCRKNKEIKTTFAYFESVIYDYFFYAFCCLIERQDFQIINPDPDIDIILIRL